jgi:hypothetical protein
MQILSRERIFYFLATTFTNIFVPIIKHPHLEFFQAIIPKGIVGQG